MAAIVVLFGVLGAGASAQQPAPARYEMTVEGPILVNSSGMTLYRHTGEAASAERPRRWYCTTDVERMTDDSQSGIGPRPQVGHRLLRSCADKFRPYVAPANAQPSGDFSVIERPDGVRQWALNGFPLYTSVKDVRPGDRNVRAQGGGGNNRRAAMEIVMRDDNLPAGLEFQRRAEGLVLVTRHDARAVYTPTRRGRLLRTSVGGSDFRPIAAPAIATAQGDWSIVSDTGQPQYAYRGQPLYAPPAGVNRLQLEHVEGWQPVVVHPAPPLPGAIRQQLTLFGEVYANPQGMTLYTYTCTSRNSGASGRAVEGVSCDDAGDPAAFMVALCGESAECARRWHPYLAERNARPVGEFAPMDITYPMFIEARGELYPADGNRVRVWAYRGRPLYTYYEDERPGDTLGDRIGGIWGSNFNVVQVPGRSATDFEP